MNEKTVHLSDSFHKGRVSNVECNILYKLCAPNDTIKASELIYVELDNPKGSEDGIE